MSVADDVRGLEALSSAALRERWARLTGTPVPRISPALLRLALAWEMQACATGGPSRATTRTLDQLARGATRTTPTRPGLRLLRAWEGKVHVVTTDEDGTVHWDGRPWRSLSAVARAITGTRWSGPAFFGLRKSTDARRVAT